MITASSSVGGTNTVSVSYSCGTTGTGTIGANPTAITCGQQSQIAVTNAPAGSTSVVFTATGAFVGSGTSQTATVSGTTATVNFSAPQNFIGVATITATANGVSLGSVGVTVTCGTGTGLGGAVTWIVVSPSTLTCGQQATIQASPPGVAAGTLVSLTANQGLVTPATTTLIGTTVSATYTAPVTATAATTTITVSAGGVSGSAFVALNCTGIGAGATSINVSAAPTSLNCGSSSFVTATTNTPGATVNLATSLGTISPTTTTDSGSGVLAVLTAPQNQGGTATVTVTSGAARGTTTVTINCAAAATAVPATAVPVAPAPVAPAPLPAVISPPNTGDGGLLSQADCEAT